MLKIVDGEEQMGNKTKVKIVKNKVAPPFKIAEFDIMYGHGIDYMGELVDIATDKNIIQKAGSWYSYLDSKLGQGRMQVRQMFIDNPDIRTEIETKLKNAS